MELLIIVLVLFLAPAILPPIAVGMIELIGCFIGGVLEVVEGITTSKSVRESREQEERRKQEEWFDYKIGHNSHRL